MLDLAVGATRTPATVPETLVAELREHLDDQRLVELVSSIAWENYRARFNHCLGIEAAGFSEGAFCPMPERP